MNEKEEEEEHDDNKKEEEEEEEHDDKKKSNGKRKNMMTKKRRKGKKNMMTKKIRKGKKKNMMTKKTKKEEEEGHDDTIHLFLSYRDGKQCDFPSLLCDVKQSDFPSLLRNSLHQEGLSVQYVPTVNWILQNKQTTYTLSKALQKSRIAIIVFSKNYADSAYRLKELVQMLNCFNGEGRLIYLVIYDVDPSEAWAQLEKKLKGKREWRLALAQAAGLSDYHHFLPKTMNIDKCIQAIVDRVTSWMNEKDKYWVWKKGKEIGHGAHGIVYEARHRKTGAICGALKELNTDKVNTSGYIQKEIIFLSQLEKHPNIVEYYDHKKEGRLISLYMEYIRAGSLEKYISDRGKLDGSLVQNFTAQILFGLVHLHSKRRVHRDLKPGNLLIDSTDSKDIVKLADFGLVELVAESRGKHSMSGTLLYAAPELLFQAKYRKLHDALAADIWSLGCVIIKMFSQLQPCWSISDLHPSIPKDLCKEGRDFLKRCFKIEPAKRPSAKELLEDPFVKAHAVALKNTGVYKD
ncbi:hypothetical protein QN277_024998 [Acacia crassicarpa]|uniref:Protein kinase domain-containing protein n=1 Tax=Acacia crassicarpa TaxID=499986 RepID=A0AAE1JF14_9FABA|nr:hypothetical protein QN277_024998 [Acacia crassicarpa]